MKKTVLFIFSVAIFSLLAQDNQYLVVYSEGFVDVLADNQWEPLYIGDYVR